MIALALMLAALLLAWTGLIYIRLRVASGGIFVLLFKSWALACAPFLSLIGLAGLLAGALFGLPAVMVAYGLLALVAGIAVLRIRRRPEVITPTFGATHPPEAGSVRGAGAPPRHRRDVPCGTPPERGRPLLCDLWQPPAGVVPSGLAFIYFHGSGWTILDKDYRTRPLFSRLCAQGHLVMDVAYRLFPETDIPGMVGDVRRAVAWLKEHAAQYGVNPDRIVIGGGSAGGHIAMLAAYTEGLPALTPPDLQGVDTAVRGVISWYGPSDLAACYRHFEVAKLAAQMPTQPDWQAAPPAWAKRLMGADVERLGFGRAPGTGRLDWIVGGSPETVPDRYALLSPIHHVHTGCPPTLLMQGEHDLIVPVESTERLAARLREAGVPVANLILPVTDHAFDLFGTRWSPSARMALWHTERFLAWMAS